MTVSPLILALAVAAAPRVAVLVHTTGFSDEDARRIADKARAEAAATGVELGALGGAVDVKPECLEDRACARELLGTADLSFLVSLNVLRAGGQASLSAVLIDGEGRVAAETQGVRKLDLVLGEGALLAAEIVTRAPADGYTLLQTDAGPEMEADVMSASETFVKLIRTIANNAEALLVERRENSGK